MATSSIIACGACKASRNPVRLRVPRSRDIAPTPDLEQHHGIVHDNILQSLNRASALANRRRPAKELDPTFFALNQLRLARVVWSRAFHHTDKVEHKLMVTIEHTINYPKIVALMLRQL